MGTKPPAYVSAFLALCTLKILVFGRCDSYRGPIQIVCRNVSHQWDACVTTAFMQTFTHGERQCILKYCSLYCMREKYGKPVTYVGPVYDDCTCNPELNTTTEEPYVILPTWCHSPDGTNCNWYSTCLEKVHPCIADVKNGHAVEYAIHFCDLYKRYKHHFSVKTKQWIDSVRRCLLVKLVPLIRPFFSDTNCQQIDSYAADTQLQCHFEPFSFAPSVCDLDLVEWAKVFWTVKGILNKSTSEGLKNMLMSTSKCRNNLLQSVLGDTNTPIVQNIQQTGLFLVRLTVKGDHGNETVTEVKDYSEVAERITNQLAIQLRWNQNRVLCFAFVNNRSNTNEVGINIFLGSRSLYDIRAFGAEAIAMAEVLTDMVFALGNEKISLITDDRFSVTKFNACLDFGCQATAYDIVPKLKPAVSVADFPLPGVSNILLIALYEYTERNN